MFELGPEKLLMLLLICLVLFGGRRIPEIGGAIGKGIREFKRGISDIGDSVNRPIDPLGSAESLYSAWMNKPKLAGEAVARAACYAVAAGARRCPDLRTGMACCLTCRRMIHSATMTLITHPAPISTVLADSPGFPTRMNQGR